MQNITTMSSNSVHGDGNLNPFLPAGEPKQPAAAELDPKKARKEAVSDMKKNIIMDAALRVIAKSGYADVRVEEIAEEAGFSKASIYHYFPDKEALFIHIVLREQQSEHEKCVEILERGLPFFEMIREFVALIYNNQTIVSDRAARQGGVGAIASFMSNIFVSMGKHEDLLNEAIVFKIRTHNLIKSVVAKARAEGIFTIPVSDTAVCTMITSFVHSAVMGRAYHYLIKDETVCAELDKMDLNWVINALSVYFEPWIKDDNHPQRRWYDVEQK